jgi:hypothetical protein
VTYRNRDMTAWRQNTKKHQREGDGGSSSLIFTLNFVLPFRLLSG